MSKSRSSTQPKSVSNKAVGANTKHTNTNKHVFGKKRGKSKLSRNYYVAMVIDPDKLLRRHIRVSEPWYANIQTWGEFVQYIKRKLKK